MYKLDKSKDVLFFQQSDLLLGIIPQFVSGEEILDLMENVEIK